MALTHNIRKSDVYVSDETSNSISCETIPNVSLACQVASTDCKSIITARMLNRLEALVSKSNTTTTTKTMSTAHVRSSPVKTMATSFSTSRIDFAEAQPATSALLRQGSITQLDNINVKTSHSAPPMQWTDILNDDENDESSVDSTSSCDNSDITSDGDDESVSGSDDEEETRLAKELVRVAYSGGVSTPALDLLLVQTMGLKRRRNSAAQITQSSIQRPPMKQQRVAVYSNNKGNNNSPSSDGSVTSIHSSIVNSKSTLQPKPSVMTTSESTPVLRFSFSKPVSSPVDKKLPSQYAANEIKPDDHVRTILVQASLPEPKLIPYATIKNFFLDITAEAIAAYDMAVVQALRHERIDELRAMYKAGKTMQCGNKFGETIIHAAARRHSVDVVKFLLEECNVCPRVCCDSGRTPLHDACWTVNPNFDVVSLLLDNCPDLLYITDKRGFTPMQYVRQELWGQWCHYLDQRGSEKLRAKELA